MTGSLLRTTLLVLLSLSACAEANDESEADVDVHAYLQTHCVDCHGPEDPKSELDLTQLPGEPTSLREAERWERVLIMLQRGQMPPDEVPRPEQSATDRVVSQIEATLGHWIARSEQLPAAVARRLTNFEYQNTMRDLLGFELRLAEHLPEDPVIPYRFNNSAELLLMGAEQLQRYEENAARAMAAAIVDPATPDVHNVRKEWKSERQNNELAVTGNRRGNVAGGLSVRQWPEHGEYRIRVQASGLFPEGTAAMPLRLVMGYGLAGDIGAAPFFPVGTIHLNAEDGEPRIYEFRGRIENHPVEPQRQYRRGGTRTGNLTTIPASLVITPQNLFDDGTLNDGIAAELRPRAVIDWIEFEAPVADTWPPEHHTRILFASPLRDSDPMAYVKQVLQRFLSRAFRRPATSQDVDRYAQIYQIFAADGASMEAAVRDTLAVALTSPAFLYHEHQADAHYRMASRLSYFLWGTMPDETLLERASAGQLQDPVIIAEQVRRLLADDRAHDFVRNFSTQWLALQRCRTLPINTRLFPRFLYLVKKGQHAGEEVPFRPTVRDDMLDETVAFVLELIRSNEQIDQIVDSDFAMLNERLAAHYGVRGVQGHQLRRVALPADTRLGGLLTQGAVLTGTGTGSAPHPIYRAKWLREAILGDHVKDPPADVPALEDSAGDSADQAANIKDLLRAHRQKVSCNDCHARLDPWGIAFEHYNAVGQYQPKVPPDGVRVLGFDAKKHTDAAGYQQYLDSVFTVSVDAASTLPGGAAVNGMEDLKSWLLLRQQDVITENMVRRLLSYGLGRSLTVRDRFAVDQLVRQARRSDAGLQDLIVAICQSDLFLKRDN
ncbi:MAG: DUF1592 domain-containing protein [Planctomycetaceae bacterium]|nr:DUF1592 domain-containing protein [Planctomycetaceae bacterium]